mgnify:FL=1
MENNIENRIKNVMAAVFELTVDKINDEASPDTIESWDSLKHMNLIIALEEEFNIVIPDEEVGNMLTFGLVLLIVNEAI